MNSTGVPNTLGIQHNRLRGAASPSWCKYSSDFRFRSQADSMMNGLNSFDDAEVGRMFKMQRMQQAMQQEFGNMHGGNGPHGGWQRPFRHNSSEGSRGPPQNYQDTLRGKIEAATRALGSMPRAH